MGGAERAERKRRQQQQQQAGSKAVAKARGGGGDTKKVVAVVVGVVVLAGAVIGGVLWTNASKNATEGESIPAASGQQRPTSTKAPEYPEKRDGLVVVSGQDDAKITLDVYADFLCPICGQFEQTYGKQIEDAVAKGQVKLRTHMVPLLVEQSDPPGYSLESANAALLAADEGKFTQYHDSLFASQPEEGKRGYDKDQLIQLGRDVGIKGDDFATGVRNGKFDKQLTAELQQIVKDPALAQEYSNGQKGFGTPTVVANGKILQPFSDKQWLDKLLGSAG